MEYKIRIQTEDSGMLFVKYRYRRYVDTEDPYVHFSQRSKWTCGVEMPVTWGGFEIWAGSPRLESGPRIHE